MKKPISGRIRTEMNKKFSKKKNVKIVKFQIPSSGNLPDRCTHLIPLEDVRLSQCLHGVQVIRVDLPHQGHFTKGSDTDRCKKNKKHPHIYIFFTSHIPSRTHVRWKKH